MPSSRSACSETITRPPIRYVAQLPLPERVPIHGSPRQTSDFSHCILESHSLQYLTLATISLDSHHGLSLMPQSAVISLAAVQDPLSCSPFLATIIGEYTLSRYILVDLMSCQPACGWTFAHLRSAPAALIIHSAVRPTSRVTIVGCITGVQMAMEHCIKHSLPGMLKDTSFYNPHRLHAGNPRTQATMCG